MAAHGLWFWLLVNLGYDHQFHQRVFRKSIDNSEACQKPRNSFLWVMKRSPPVYFFGTIHVPYTKVWDYIPLNSKKAFYETNNIYVELNLLDPDIRRTLVKCQMLPDGIVLRDVVPKTLYKRIKRHLSYIRRKMSVWMTFEQRMMNLTPLHLYKMLTNNWHKKRPIWVMLMLNALTEYDIKSRGISVLDTYLIRRAKNKHIGSIESVEEQCEPLNAINNSQVLVALNQTVVLHENIRKRKAKLTYSTKELIYHYNCGDLSKVLFNQDTQSVANVENSSASNNVDMEETRKIDHYLREELIYKRNKRMAKRVVHLIQEEPKKSFFFAFGAGHFLGNGSLIDILQKQGYNISHLQPNDPLPRYGPNREVKDRICKKKKHRRRKGRKRKRFRKRRKRKCEKPPNRKMSPTPLVVPVTQRNRRLAVPSSSSKFVSVNLWLDCVVLYLAMTTFGA